jgi:CxxC motif-containing protein (DUF1111 family)
VWPDRAQLLAEPIGADAGGDTTRTGGGATAFTFMIENAERGRRRPFFFGNRLFNTNWTVAPASVRSFDGLGPIFNRSSCSGCHLRDGRGRPPDAPDGPFESMLFRISVPGSDPHGGPLPVPGYGDQIGDRAILGVVPEALPRVSYVEEPGLYPDGTPYSLRRPVYELREPGYGAFPDDMMVSPRVAPAMIGLGLLEAVPDALILGLDDPDDADGDGVSGRPNIVWDVIAGAPALGRFGWKANQPSLLQQNLGAAFGDIGLTSYLHADENCTEVQADCAAAVRGPELDLADESFIEKLTLYTRIIAVPRRRDVAAPEVAAGEAAFRAAGCAACHMPTLVTGAFPEVPELAGQTFHPFTDLLLHDMGEGLADGRPDFLAGGREWRTAPLWGMGLYPETNGHEFLLHDGRARGPEEAILWHGGEAEGARDAFMALPAGDRAALLRFLRTL